MYCPKCSHQQISEDVRFCSKCGLPLDAVAKLLTREESFAEESETSEYLILKPSAASRFGIKLMFFSVVLIPFIFALSYAFDSPIPFTIPVLIFFAGLSHKTYNYIFGEDFRSGKRNIRSKNANSIESDLKVNLLATRLYHELKQADGFSSLAVEGLMLELIAETSRNYVKATKTNRPAWLDQVEVLLKKRFFEPLTLGDIAESVKIHPTHLTRVFQSHNQCTVGEYIRKLRIEHACDQLTSTDAPLAEIALESGFYDQSHFSRIFKQITGLTPTEYRAAAHLC